MPSRPFFVFLNYFDAHFPYKAPAPFDKEFGSGGPMPDPSDRRLWTTKEIRRTIEEYDGALRYLDNQLGELCDALKAKGLSDNTLIAITSDHGEEFGEHGLYEHGNSLYLPLLHVPLILSFPKEIPSGIRISQTVSLLDLPATLLELAGLGTHALGGHSLADYWRNTSRAPSVSSAAIAEVEQGINLPIFVPASPGPMRSVILGHMHYIRNGDGTEEVYNFADDPEESENLSQRAYAQGMLNQARTALLKANTNSHGITF
jgi:arylsulfatase A-like enzyme